MRKKLKSILISLGLIVVFITGILVGNNYQFTDILCPASAKPFVLQSDFITDNGITFPKGTVLPLRQCAYMQRFTWHFAIDNSVKLKPSSIKKDDDYGFSELEPKK
jgi:hypothetical protein